MTKQKWHDSLLQEVFDTIYIIDWQWQTHISHTDTSYNAVGTIASKNIIYKNTTSGTIDWWVRQTKSWYTPLVEIKQAVLFWSF